MAPWTIILENPMIGIVIITLLYAVVFQFVMKKPAVEKFDPTMDSFIGDGDDSDWADEKDKEVKSRNKAAEPTPKPKPEPAPLAAPTKPRKSPIDIAMELAERNPRQLEDGGPFKIGDRVIIHGLKNQAALNRRHGHISALRDPKTQRYMVDTDLIDPKRPSVSVKAENIEKEPHIPAKAERERAVCNKGMLDETNARAISFVFQILRSVAGNALKGEKDLDKIVDFGWAFWTTPDGKGVFPALAHFIKVDVLKQNGLEKMEKQLNPNNPKGGYDIVPKAVDDVKAVKGWNVRVQGEFWIVGMNDQGTLIIPVANLQTVYCVLGVRVPLAAQVMGKFPRPVKFKITLLPWYGRIVHDVALGNTSGGPMPEVATPAVAQVLLINSTRAQKEGRVISRFAQLEVPGGSKKGLPFVPTKPSVITNNAPDPASMVPANDEEKKYMNNIVEFEPFPFNPAGAQTEEEKAGMWNYIRKGTTEEENPNHDGMCISGGGQMIDRVSFKSMRPTAEEILKSICDIASKTGGKRPALVGVDDPACFARLQFLFKDIAGTKVVGINVNRQQKPPEGAKKIADVSNE